MRPGQVASRRASWTKPAPLLVALILASPAAQLAPARALEPFEAHSSDNIEYLSTVQVGGATEGSRLIGNHLFVTDNNRGLVIYDVTDPERPVVVGEANVPHIAENEDIATNGSIALLSQGWFVSFAAHGAHHVHREPASALNVIDVSDRTAPAVIATIPGAGDHTYECLFDCRWAYGALSGHIIDLRDPAHPRIAGNWKEEIGLPYPTLSHDTTEVAPGSVLVAGDGVIYYLNTRDPLHPTMLARSESVANAYLHTVLWPESRKGTGQRRGDLILSSTESVGPTLHCSVDKALTFNHFRTWDATRWKKTGTFELIDEYGPNNGMFTDGDPPASVRGTYFSNNGCSSHWFEPHPGYRNNGLVALGTYSHGMKLLRVTPKGDITEVGYFLPESGDVGAAYWMSGKVLYSISPDRGAIDILRYTGTT